MSPFGCDFIALWHARAEAMPTVAADWIVDVKC
jgi:hypothetical protein